MAVENGGHVNAPKPIRRRNSLDNLTDFDTSGQGSDNPVTLAHQGKTNNITQIVQNTMATPAFISTVAPSLVEGLVPHLADLIGKAMQPLLDKIDNQCSTIDSLKEALSEKINTIENMAADQKHLRKEVQILSTRLSDLEQRHDDLDQYGRRSTLRFHNVPVKPGESDGTDAIILDICNNKLKVTPPLELGDIERSHKIGKVKGGYVQIICIFRGWKVKHRVYMSKSELKKFKSESFNVYISEDLTKKRQAIIKVLSDTRKSGEIESYWTNDGRIFYKESQNSAKIHVQSMLQVDNLSTANRADVTKDNGTAAN